jgi:hypothetical protein
MTQPGRIPRLLKKEGNKFFDIVKDGSQAKAGIVKDGIVTNVKDGSFEHYLFTQGIPLCIVTETPPEADLNKRIDCNYSIIKMFVDEILK